jgi:hypothetical protein
MPPLLQNGMFNPAALLAQVYQVVGQSYPPGTQRSVSLAVAEALSWLLTQGLLVLDPGQPSPGFYVPTRRAQRLRTRADVEAFRKVEFSRTTSCRRCLPKRSCLCFAVGTMTWRCSRRSRRWKLL